MNQDPCVTPEANPYQPTSNLLPAESWIPDISSMPVKLSVLAVMSFLIGMFVLGVPPSLGYFDYTRDIPISEAIAASLTANWPVLIARSDGHTVWFPMVAVGGLLAYLLSPKRWMPMILALHLVMILIYLPGLLFFLLPFAPLIVIGAAAGQADGELWSEGFVCMGAMACWANVWLLLTGMAWLRQRSIRRKQANPA